jgi:hypothetical protein
MYRYPSSKSRHRSLSLLREHFTANAKVSIIGINRIFVSKVIQVFSSFAKKVKMEDLLVSSQANVTPSKIVQVIKNPYILTKTIKPMLLVLK